MSKKKKYPPSLMLFLQGDKPVIINPKRIEAIGFAKDIRIDFKLNEEGLYFPFETENYDNLALLAEYYGYDSSYFDILKNIPGDEN